MVTKFCNVLKKSPRRWLPTAIFLFAVTISACGGNNPTGASGDESSPGVVSPPELGSARPSLPLQERRLGIVYSEPSAQGFFGEIEYNQLYAAMQHHAVQAGLSFDLLHEQDLLDTQALQQYSALIFPLMNRVTAANKDQITDSLVSARRAGVAMVVSGDFLLADENGDVFGDGYAAMESTLGLRARNHLTAVPTDVKIANSPHPVISSYDSGELLLSYQQAWYAEYETTIATDPAVLLSLESADADGNVTAYNGAYAFDFDSRIVHFSNPKVMADHDLLASAIEWAVYGTQAPVTLLPSRHESVFLARNDMDQAMLADQLIRTEIPLLPIITDWKERFNFVGSYYIDVGNNPSIGQYTNWSVSGPLYRKYIDLGSEIGTHSWTHPHFTSELNNEELEFEFNQSRIEIGDNVGSPVLGGAVPGNPENMHVVENLNQWFEYFSGRSGIVDAGFPNATGYMEPQHQMRYFSLNMSPDFTLIDFLGHSPEAALDIWLNEIDELTANAKLPVMHWLWHDYGPTTSAEAGTYSVAMFADTLDYAHSLGTEFVTLADYHNRLDALEHVRTSVALDDEIRVEIQRQTDASGNQFSGLGQSALRLHESTSIERVTGWYAYDSNQVFVPENGGSFRIITGSESADLTHISALPMRAKLIDVEGNGNELSFTLEGEGEVTITLSEVMVGNVIVQGGASVIEDANTLIVQLDSNQIHNVSVSSINPVNSAPVAEPQFVTASFATPVELTLAGSDAEQDTLRYTIIVPPSNGTLSGAAPNLVYTPTGNFTGTDSFQYQLNDGDLSSFAEIVEIEVAMAQLANLAPEAFPAVFETLVDQTLSVQLNAKDNENQPLVWQIVEAPRNGTLSGAAPALIYLPDPAFAGTDSFTFRVDDGVSPSETATVTVHVSETPTPVFGSVSNPLSEAPLIDADLSDWGSAVLLGTDPQDIVSATNPIDWKSVRFGHTSSRFYLAYEMYSPQSPSWGHQIFIDTDGDINTGFRGFGGEFPIGADYLIESATLITYGGDNVDQTVWSWTGERSLAIANVGPVVEMEIVRAHLGRPDAVQLFLVGDNNAVGGTQIDHFPDTAAVSDALPSTRRFSYSVDPAADGSTTQPYALGQSLSLTGSAALPIRLDGFDADNDALNFTIVSQPQNGVLEGTPPLLAYTPDSGFVGEDSFSFVVDDGQLQSGSARVLLSVVAPTTGNHIPVAHGRSFSLASNETLAIELTASDADSDPLQYRIDQGPGNGRLSGDLPNLVYQPDAGFSGIDNFSFYVFDGVSESAPVPVEFHVADAPVNLPPIADSQSLSTPFETAIGVVLSGFDGASEPLVFTIIREPALGNLSGVIPDLTYTPHAGASGADSFEFIVSDGVSDSQPATVAINVGAPLTANQAPLVSDLVAEVVSGQALPLTLSATDADGDRLTYTVLSQPANGTLSGVAPALVYQAEQGFTGQVEFNYQVNDGSSDSNVGTVAITVVALVRSELSNPGASISVDGELSDWSGLSVYAPDPNDIKGPSNTLDWLGFYAAHSNNELFLAFRNDGEFAPSWGHAIYIDTDNDMNTGFRGFDSEYPVGADVLVESNSIHIYTGDGTSWSWSFIETGQIARQGGSQEMSFSLDLLQNVSQLRFFLLANNEAVGGTSIDFYPDAATDADAPMQNRVLLYRLTP